MRQILVISVRLVIAGVAGLAVVFAGSEALALIYQNLGFDPGKVGVWIVIGGTLGAASGAWQLSAHWLKARNGAPSQERI
jgi:hypothetical protein